MMIPSLMVASFIALVAPAGADERLADAAMRRDTARVRALLAEKVDVNAPGKEGSPALHWTVRVDDLETAQALISAGADVKLADRFGVTPLYLACTNGNAAMVKLR
jgi:ankyrin repeat protein